MTIDGSRPCTTVFSHRVVRRTTRPLNDPSAAGQRALSISIGAAVFPDDSQDDASLLRAADRALYEAKRSGRDRVCVAGAPGERELALPPE